MSEELKQRLNKNIIKIYISDAIGSMSFSSAIYTLFILAKGFNLEQFFLLEAAYALSSFLTQILTGTFADKYGRKTSIIVSTLINIPGILMLILSKDFSVLIWANLIGGVAESFYNGAGPAMLYDTVKSLGKSDQFKKISGRNNLYCSITAAVGVVIGGFLAHYKLEYAMWAYFAVQLPVLIVDATLIEPPVHEPSDPRPLQHIKASIWQAFRGEGAYFVMYSAIITLFFSLGYWLWQPYLKAVAVPILYFGFVYAAINLISGFFSSQAHKIEKKIGMQTSLLLIPLVLVLSFIFQSQMVLIYGAVFLLIHAIIGGYSGPIIADYLNSRIPSAQRATVLSIEYMINDGLFIVLSPLLGHFVDLYSLQTAYLIMAAMLLVTAFIFWLVFKKQKVAVDPILVEIS